MARKMSTTLETDILAKKRLHLVRGIPITTHFKQEFVEETLDYEPRDGDVIITSYPKTGTTWISYIVLQILTNGESFPNKDEMLYRTIPFMESTGKAAVDAITTNPRVYKHHFPYGKIKKNPNAKYIYIYRKPEDTFVSYYHFLRYNSEELDFDQYFEDFLSGEISYGLYFDHVLSFLKHKEDSNMLLISYESLKENTREEIKKISKFLGEEYYKNITENEEILDKIILHTSFDYMKRRLVDEAKKDAPSSNNESARDASHFFRKGVVGEGKKSLKADQLQRLRKLTEERMKETEVLLEWTWE
ncbi:sulfotransferase 1B1 isoform X2 [Parasteatoda tepidariorum]|uniref:sulfotransferase 1B1 isoform X2 n=1 Tax=Parasteatoda tepidariorum TaxID=114398 RepID=UPI0039BD7A22